MKKVLYSLLMAVVMIGLGSCSNTPKTMDLTGTEWVSTQSLDLNEDGEEGDVPFVLEVTTTLAFTSDTDGTMSFEMMGESESEPITYTCDAEGNGVLTSDGETDGNPTETNFVVKGDKLTIVEEDGSYEFTKK